MCVFCRIFVVVLCFLSFHNVLFFRMCVFCRIFVVVLCLFCDAKVQKKFYIMEKIEKKFSNAKERFKYYLELQGKSKNKFYELSGMANGLLDKNGDMTEGSILKICDIFPEISLEWLLLEKVAMATAPSAIANNGEMKNLAPAELLSLLTSQQESIKALTETVRNLTSVNSTH